MTARPTFPLRRALLALAATGALALAPAAAAMTGGTLVVNGDAETPVGAEWATTGGALLRQAYGTGGYPGPVLIGGGTFDGGTALFHGSGASSVARQTVTLGPDDRAAIATGTVRARLSAYLGGYAGQRDRMGVDAVWHDAEGAPVLTQALPPVTLADRGGVSGFLRRADERPVPVDAASVTITLTSTRETAPAADGYADDVAVHLIGIPAVAVTTAREAEAGRPTPVTWTVANSEDLETKPPWRFTTELPEGVTLASSRPVRTTCADARVTADRTTLRVAGVLPPGAASCAVTADVLADEGRHVFVPDAVQGAEGVRPPAVPTVLVAGAAGGQDDPGVAPTLPGSAVLPTPTVLPGPPVPASPPPVVAPVPGAPTAPPARVAPLPRAADALAVAATAPSARLRLGRRAAVEVRVRNRSRAPLTAVDVCVRLPRGLLYLPTRSGTAPVDGRRCWTVRRLPAGATRTLRLAARAVRPGRAVLRLTAEAAEAAGTTSTDRTIRVTR